MAEYPYGIKHIIAEVAAVGAGQIAITPSLHAIMGINAFGYKNATGTASYVCAVIDMPARFTNLTVSNNFVVTGGTSDIQESGMGSAVTFTDILTNKTNVTAILAALADLDLDDVADTANRVAVSPAQRDRIATSVQYSEDFGIGDSFEINQDAHTGSTDKAAVENRDLTELGSKQIANEDYSYMDVNSQYIAAVDGTSADLYIFDKNTGSLIKTIPGVTADEPIVFIDLNMLVQVSNNLVVTIDIISEEITTRSTSSAVDGAFGLDYHDGYIYWLPQNNSNLSKMDVATWTLTNVSPGTAPSNHAFATVSDGTHVFILDAYTASATSYVRKYLIADGTQSAISAGFTTDQGAYSAIDIIDDKINLTTDTGASAGEMQCKIFAKSNLTTLFSGTQDITAERSAIYDGILTTLRYFNVTYYDAVAVQLPSLTFVAPDFEDRRGGSGISSAEGVTNEDGTDFEYTKADEARAVKDHKENGRLHGDRDVDADADITIYDRNNIIGVLATRTADVTLTPTAAVLATRGFRFGVYVEYDASYSAFVNIGVGEDWECATGNVYDWVFWFTIINGVPVPDNTPVYSSA